MALARSASGPGGLSINTGSANIFGSSTSQPPAGGGLFGSAAPAASQPAQAGGLFGGTAASQQPAGSLFGSGVGQPAASQPAASGGLFGGAGTQATAQPARPLFGSATTATPQALATGGLFGAAAPATQTQPSGGLFGSATTQPQQTGGLFGGGAAAAPAAAPSTGGLFGGTNTGALQPQQTGGLFGNTASQPQQTGGLFGSAAPAQPQATGGLFGSTATNTAAPAATGGLFGGTNTGGGMFGQPQARPAGGGFFGSSTAQPTTSMLGQSQQQVIPGVRIDVSNLRSTTRFNDLQEDLQRQISSLDDAIQKCIKDCEAVDAFMPSHQEQLEAIPRDVAFVARKSEGMHGALASDVVAIKQLRDLANEDCDNARLSFRAIDNQKLPTQYHQAGLWSTRAQQGTAGGGDAEVEGNSDLISFFSKTADEMDDTMRRFQGNLGEIELHLRGLQENMLEEIMRLSALSQQNGAGADDRVAELAAVLRDFEESILRVASDVGGVREGMTGLQLGDFMGNGTNGLR